MFSVNRMSNGQRPYISNKEQNKRVAVAFCIAITIVIIVLSLLFAGLMLSYGRVDSESPVIICPNDISRTIPLNTGGAIITWSPPQISDNSGQASIASSTHISGQFFFPGTTMVTYTVSDPSGNTAECSFLVIVIEVDSESPVIICPNDISRTIPLNTDGAIITWSAPQISDNSGQARIASSTHISGQFFLPDTTVVTYTVSDPSGNTAECSFLVNVIEVDSESPVIICPNDITRTIPLNTGGAIITWSPPQIFDNSGQAFITGSTHTSGQFFLAGTTVVTYTVSDPSGNTAECSFLVNVIEVDSESPVIICPNDITRSIPLNDDGAIIHWSVSQISDNSGQVSITSTHTSGHFFLAGTTVVTITASDPSGNTAECSFLVIVKKDMPCNKKEDNDPNMVCEIKQQPFNKDYIGNTVTSIPISSCYMTLACDNSHSTGFPLEIHLKTCIESFGNPYSSFTYTYPSNGPTPTVTHVLVNSCHGCLCLKIQVAFCAYGIEGGGMGFIGCDQTAPPTLELTEGEQVTVKVTKTGTDPSSVDIQIVDQTATAADDYQEIAPFNLDFIDFGDQEMFFTIDTYDDAVTEGVETFAVQLSNPSSGTIEYPILTITILDND